MPLLTHHGSVVGGVALVTGGTGAICSEVSAGLALAGMRVVLTCRPGSVASCRTTTEALWASRGVPDGVAPHVEPVDLSNFGSLARMVATVLEKYGKQLRVLVNCASASPPVHSTTADGLELQFQLNVWAYYALIVRLLPVLARNAPSSVVNVASGSAFSAAAKLTRDGLNEELQHRKSQGYDANRQYCRTKAADVLLTWAAARVYANTGVFFNANHPGLTPPKASRLVRDLMAGVGPAAAKAREKICCDTPHVYARNTLTLALNATVFGWSGRFHNGRDFAKRRPLNDPELSSRLWESLQQVDSVLSARTT